MHELTGRRFKYDSKEVNKTDLLSCILRFFGHSRTYIKRFEVEVKSDDPEFEDAPLQELVYKGPNRPFFSVSSVGKDDDT